MKFVESKVSEVATPRDCMSLRRVAKLIEECGRVAYKSEDKITRNSYYNFLKMLSEKKHLSCFEHGSIYLKIPLTAQDAWRDELEILMDNPYSTYQSYFDGIYITTNMRVIVENDLWHMIEEFYINYNEKVHSPRITFKIICDRGVSHELVRHRGFSFTQESTRYCNYTKSKFGRELTFIIPSYVKGINDGETYVITTPQQVMHMIDDGKDPKTVALIAAYSAAEVTYDSLISQGSTPQEARAVLPTGIKTEVMMTGTLEQWLHFLSLRSPKYGAKGVHPDMAKIADEIYELLVIDEYITKKEDNDKED